MKPRTILLILPVLLVVIHLSRPASAQQIKTRHAGGAVMSASEYKAYLSRVDEAIPRWTKIFEQIDAAKLDISYSTGEQIMQYRNLQLSQLALLRTTVADERIQPRLFREIGMVISIQNVSDGYVGILMMIPNVPPEWDATYLKLAPEVGKFVGPLLNHVSKRAELLETEDHHNQTQ